MLQLQIGVGRGFVYVMSIMSLSNYMDHVFFCFLSLAASSSISKVTSTSRPKNTHKAKKHVPGPALVGACCSSPGLRTSQFAALTRSFHLHTAPLAFQTISKYIHDPSVWSWDVWGMRIR